MSEVIFVESDPRKGKDRSGIEIKSKKRGRKGRR